MATEMVSHPSGSNLFCNSGNFGIGEMYGLNELSKAEMAAPRLIMLANVALTGEVSNGCCDYSLDEDRQMAELTTVYENSFSDCDGERMELEELGIPSESGVFDTMEMEPSEGQEEKLGDPAATTPESQPEGELENKNEIPPPRTEDNTKCVKSKPFRCRPCQYKAESEEDFVHHIKDHSAKKFIDDISDKTVQDPCSCTPEEVDLSKGPIRCDRCGYNTNRFDHYLAHLKHHNKDPDNERVYKCIICTYTTISQYHWKKHLRNHFPRIVYTCSQCSYFSDRKNNYIQHIRTHTGERPYQCALCPYTSSQKTHLTRHIRTHSGEKPFKCEQCNYVASNQHEVTRHARQVHNGPKPLTCPHCKYRTADRSNFKKHVELHVNPRQFLCPICDYAASKKCNLQYHIRSRHSGCTDITMDVSKVKLRAKKGTAAGSDAVSSKQEDNENCNGESEPPEKKDEGDAAGSDAVSNKQEDKENCNAESEPPEKKDEGDAAGSDAVSNTQEDKENCNAESEPPEKKDEVKPKADTEKCVKVKQASSLPVGQITTRSHKTNSLKTEEDTNANKGKCAKRKSSVVSEKPVKMNDTQNTNLKKRKLEQKSKHADDIPTNTVSTGKSKKQTVSVKKTNCKKPLKNKNKKNVPARTSTSKKTSGKSMTAKEKTDEDLEAIELKDPANEKSDVPLTEKCLPSCTEPTQEEVEAIPTTTDCSNLDAESKTKESAVRDASLPDPTVNPDSSTLEVTLESDPLLLEKNSDINKVKKVDSNSVISPVANKPVLETQSAPDIQPSTVASPAEEHESIPDVHGNDKASGSHYDSASNSSLEGREEPQQTTPSDNSEQCVSTTITENVSNCDPKVAVHTQSHEALDIEEDEGIHSHEGSDISDNVSERSDDSGLNGLQSLQETLESRPLLEVPSASTTAANEIYVCIFCDRAFKKGEEYTKHLKRHLVNVYYLEKAAQNR